MNYTPARIEHLDDVLPHIEGRSDFIVVRKERYTVVDYIYVLPDSFDDPCLIVHRECSLAPGETVADRSLGPACLAGMRPALYPNYTEHHTDRDRGP